MPKINPDRLLADLRELRRYGACGNGVKRQSLTPVDLESRQWLLEKMRAAGLDASIDAVGNVIGRSPNPGPALLMGSHSDTQPEGGWLDGAMGVIYALEIARALNESADSSHLALDIASWMDEEATFTHFVGTRSFCGLLSEEDKASATNADGVSLADALKAAGYDQFEPARLDLERHIGYLEAHIEQGAVLEADSKRIGVVTAIVGIRSYVLRFEGEQNHAGTTSMPLRKDAGMALFKFASALDEAFREIAAANTVWTVGDARLYPGAEAVVPGVAEMKLQFRDPDDAVLDRFAARLEEFIESFNAAKPVQVSITYARDPIRPALMDESLQQHIVDAAERHAPGNWKRMPSGAGHDAQVYASFLPTAMMFIPSIRGVSHSFEEDTNEADIALGCQVFADAAESILRSRLG